jgi:hypothetical protein
MKEGKNREEKQINKNDRIEYCLYAKLNDEGLRERWKGIEKNIRRTEQNRRHTMRSRSFSFANMNINNNV